MRNLKRALSLVLTMVMLLGMVMVPASADSTNTVGAIKFADADEIKYTDAVAITGGVGLFAGTDGKFLPKGTVTRAQMATIIVKMLNGADANADSFKGNGKFVDTPYFEGGWAEGYINWCSTLGIVAGYGDGTFRPGQAVTTAEAATMILNALKIDAGPGTWPNTVMSKATEEKLFEDLKPMPDTNTALTREELAVMSLNGMNYSPDGKNLYQVGDHKFDSAADAHFYIQANGGTMEVLLGKDSLSSKVFGLKKMEGWITANQSTGEDYTEILNSDNERVWFDLVTDENDLGHKVEVWYKEAYTDEDERGTAYTLIDQFNYITLTEDAVDEDEYRNAFGRKYELNLQAAVDGSFNVKFDADAAAVLEAQATDYVVNASAPAGTYAIDEDTKTVCAYYAPVKYTAAKVGFVNTAAGQESITIGSEILQNNEDEDVVIEYEGIAKDDYAVYYAVQDMYVVAKMETVTGTIESWYVNDEGKKVVKVNGTEYVESAADNKITAVQTAANVNKENKNLFGQTYTFFLAPDGTFVCFVKAKDNELNLNGTLYLLGKIEKTEKDAYGKKTTNYYARGVDMTGNEALVLIGAKPEGEDLVGYDALPAGDNDFYTVKENTTSKQTRELGLFELTVVPEGYNEEDPTAPFVWDIPYGQTGDKWAVGAEFEFGVSDKFTGSSSNAAPGAAYSYGHKNTKYLVVAGNAAQGYPLETAVYNLPLTLYFGARSTGRALLTRQAGNVDSIEALVFPVNNLDSTTNATVIYAPKQANVSGGKIEWGDLRPTGTTVNGNTFKVHNALTGEVMDITVDETITRLPSGFYSVGYDSEEQLHKIAVNQSTGLPYKLAASSAKSSSALAAKEHAIDGRYFENFLYDQKIAAMSGSSIWLDGWGSASLSASGAKIVDIRSDVAIAASGIGKITSLDQIYSLQESMPWVTIEMDMCCTDGAKLSIFVEVYNNQALGIDTLVYGANDGDTTVTVLTGKMHNLGDVISLPAGTTVSRSGFYNLVSSDGKTTLKPVDMGATGGVVFAASDLPTYDTYLNVSGLDALNSPDGVAAYGVVEYLAVTVDEKDVLMILAAGEKDVDRANSFDAPVMAGEYDSVVDRSGNGIDKTNIEAKQKTMCLTYTTYNMAGNKKMLTVDDVDNGTVIDNDNKAELDDITDAAVTDYSGSGITTVAQLQGKIAQGYLFSTKWYVVNGENKLAVLQCVKGSTVNGGTLTAANFANGFVKLTADASVGNGLVVSGDWTIDLNGKTLTGAAAPFIDISAGAKLTIQDSVGGGKIQGISAGKAAMIYVSGELVLESGTLTGHTSDNTSEYGGAVRMHGKDSKFTMNGGTITGNTAYRGGAIATTEAIASSKAIITINGGVISGNTAKHSTSGSSETIYTQCDVTLNINGGTVGYGTIESAQGFWLRATTVNITGAPKVYGMGVEAGCTLNISGLTEGAYIEETRGATATTDATVTKAGSVYTCADGVKSFTVLQAEGGTITLSPASAMAGATVTVNVVEDPGYELVAILVDGQVIDGNTFPVTKNHKVTAQFEKLPYNVTAEEYDDVTVELSADTATVGDTITVTATPVTGKEVYKVFFNGAEADSIGGNDYTFTMPAADVEVTVTYGDVTYNIVTVADPAAGGTVEVDAADNRATFGTTVTITVTPSGSNYRVGEVKVNGGAVDVTKVNDTTYTFVMPTENVSVTVTFNAGQSVKFASVSNLPTGDFTVEANDYGVTDAADLTTKLDDYDIHFTVFGNTVVIDYVADEAGKSTALTAQSGTIAAGKHYLSGDLTATSWLTITDEVTIDLAGHTLHAVGNNNGYVLMLTQDASKLTVMDSVGGGKIQSGTSVGNPAVFVQAGEFILNGGEITGWSRPGAAGGAVYLLGPGTFTMNGGKITGSSGGTGCAIRTTSGSKIFMTGGEISGNTGSIYGPIQIASGAEMTMSGGIITGNKATGTSAGTGIGGAIHVAAGGKLTISGTAVISNNTAGTEGGAIYNAGTVTMTGGTITGNKAGLNGGGIFVYRDASFTMNDGVISGNTSEQNGGGIGIEDGKPITITINGGKITGNTAKKYGGGISAGDGGASILNISGGEISGNTAKGGYMGGVYSHTGTFNITGGIIKDGVTMRTTDGEVNLSKAAKVKDVQLVADAVGKIGSLEAGAYVITMDGVTLTIDPEGDASVVHEDGTTVYKHPDTQNNPFEN